MTATSLFSPLPLRGLTLANRLLVSPMCQYSAQHGAAGDWHLIHYGGLAASGCGMLIVEATAVSPEGRISDGCLGLWDEATEHALARLVEGVRAHSAMPIGVQLAHAGRKASSAPPWHGGQLRLPEQGGWRPLAPSALAHRPQEPAPEALDAAGIARIREAFVDSARRAARIGVDAIELHCAHGYLLHQFLSPLSNHREDGYGGTLEARMRLPLEVFDAVRAVWPEQRPLGVRISATDWAEGGWDLAQSLVLCRALAERGCDWIDVSSGGLWHAQQVPIGPGYQVHLAREVRAACGLPTVAVGLITEPAQANAVVADGDADMVALGRALLWNPRWAWQAAAELGGQVQAPPQYWRSTPTGLAAPFSGLQFGSR